MQSLVSASCLEYKVKEHMPLLFGQHYVQNNLSVFTVTAGGLYYSEISNESRLSDGMLGAFMGHSVGL